MSDRANSPKEALYKHLRGEDFDSDTYESWQEQAEDEVEESFSDSLELDSEEYVCYSSYENAYDAAIEIERDLLEQEGAVSMVGIDNVKDFLDESWFKDFLQESYEAYFDGIQNESSSDDDLYVNRAHEEACDINIAEPLGEFEEPEESDFDDEDEYEEAYEEWESKVQDERDNVEREVSDLASEFAEEKLDELGGDYVGEYESQFGDLDDVIKNNPEIIDLDDVAEWVVDTDGAADILASYDSSEVEVDDYYLYRIG
jgi:hypothetical protein